MSRTKTPSVRERSKVQGLLRREVRGRTIVESFMRCQRGVKSDREKCVPIFGGLLGRSRLQVALTRHRALARRHKQYNRSTASLSAVPTTWCLFGKVSEHEGGRYRRTCEYKAFVIEPACQVARYLTPLLFGVSS